MNITSRPSLWRWIAIRVSVFSIATVIVFVASIWLRYALQAAWLKQQMPAAVRLEYEQIKASPPSDPTRYHQIVDRWWGISYVDPNIASGDWMTIGILVLFLIPGLVFLGLKTARPLVEQFNRLIAAARAVSSGDFTAQAQPLKDAPTEMIALVRDFNQMADQLARYDRELRASHVAMAHELRSPLTAAMGRLQGMMDGVFTPDEQQLGMVMKQLQSMSQLADALQLLSLADADHLMLDIHHVNLSELVKERIAWIRPRADRAGLNILLTAPASCPLEADASRIGQAITILLENALSYAAEGETLLIDIRQTDATVEMVFRDFGPGVSTAFLESMFDRFTRAETSRARHSGGSGLGLSIARAICLAHHGEIRAALAEPCGLEITVRLPTFSATLTHS
ncbi:signal transduction histidine kinase [Enterobacter sp. BIGb0383]|uniref:sensor histidine kinase n=1 Tax=unclassified Enterobacter TaxID=2608935 RepID=UPI000F470E2B|nr:MULTISPECIES: ATP-binding protein [unclassified Enterobacter]ROP61789.1 signal transduction histidine kinase [Enterobacter sp. BIGb0383]ROS11950.1 signal transduction histidine kinase [Enterobacter sp. BIGb0359]